MLPTAASIIWKVAHAETHGHDDRAMRPVKEDFGRMLRRIFVLPWALAIFTGFCCASLAVAEEFDSPEVDISLRDALYDELAQDADRFQRQFGIVKRIYRLAQPTIVHIDAYKREVVRGTSTSSTVDEAGAGIIVRIEDRYYVLTNRHVVHKSSLPNIKIRRADGDELTPTRIWSDPATDVAVIRIGERDVIAARPGDSIAAGIGDFVIAVGSPFGLSHSVSYGIISAKGRWDLSLGSTDDTVRFQDFIQTDAAINPGNSGGPLLNLRGEVIAMNTAIASNSGGNEGIGFAIPIHLAMSVARQLVQRGAVSTAYLGVVLDNQISSRLRSDAELAVRFGLDRPGGAYVKDVTKGSPADQARFQSGDVVVEFDGVRVEDDSHLVNLVSLRPLNDVVAIKVVRRKRPQLIHVRVADRAQYE